MDKADRKRLEEIINQSREFGEVKFDWAKSTDLDRTKAQDKLDVNTVGSAADAAQTATAKTNIDINKPDPEELARMEANARRANMTDNQREADADRDGNLTASENQKVEELNAQDAEQTKQAMKFLGGAAALATGITLASMSENEQPGNNLTPSTGLTAISNILQIT